MKISKKTIALFFVAIACAAYLSQIAFAKEIEIPRKPKIISRQQWSANEEITFQKTTSFSLEEDSSDKNEENGEEKSETVEKDPEIERIVEQNEQGRKYIWPLEYAKKIKFIVMHHTGLGNELPADPRQEMRNIFQSHTVGRQWGDVGYHYVIDRWGNIYEGRKGGEKVIGGHAKPVNKVSVGISLMGNFDEQEIPAKMLASTIALLDQLSRQYKIKPLGSSKYKGKSYKNLHGHSDNSPKKDPGKFFNQKFPFVRELLAYYQNKKTQTAEPEYDFAEIGPQQLISVPFNESEKFTIRLKNKGTITWNKNTYLENLNDKTLSTIFAKLQQDEVKPGGLGVFKGEIPKSDVSVMRMPAVSLVINGTIRPQKFIPVPIMAAAQEKPVRVALSFKENKPQIASASGMKMYSGSEFICEFGKNEIVTVAKLKKSRYRMRTNKKKFDLLAPPRFEALNDGILELVNFENRPAWNQKLNDNLFRGIIEIQKVNGKLAIINELPLEDYLKGIAEISNSDPKEKIKTIIILARSYATYYRDVGKKFPGKPYDLDDDPDHTQKYVGYGLEKRAPNIVKAVKETRGQIVLYKGKQIITPYFNQSDGRTRSAQEIWGWKDAPYLQSVPDTFCGATVLKGHGVGLSGCGATALAKQEKTAQEIIKYYYKGIEITD